MGTNRSQRKKSRSDLDAGIEEERSWMSFDFLAPVYRNRIPNTLFCILPFSICSNGKSYWRRTERSLLTEFSSCLQYLSSFPLISFNFFSSFGSLSSTVCLQLCNVYSLSVTAVERYLIDVSCQSNFLIYLDLLWFAHFDSLTLTFALVLKLFSRNFLWSSAEFDGIDTNRNHLRFLLKNLA